ncbi:MAG: class I SAM-dependent methyltransferase [Erysipelotrichaceae bacterium]|nr:class I SAM-dependent methyltransferase [Erysipelotrichaceae bacterium]
MIYQTLAPFYDLLVKDDEATQMWVDFTQKYAKGTNILELACGSGEITIALAKLGYSMYGTDLSQEMIDEAQEKEGSELVQWEALDMVQLPLDKKYDSILCYCDSLNYVVQNQDVLTVFEKVYACLEDGGVFLFDIHSLDREVEFAEEYIEEGFLDDVAYQWTIRHEDHFLYHSFTFYDANGKLEQEQHVQKVHNPLWVKEQLERIGFDVSMYTDFDLEGIQEGEKIFYVAKKVG